jgi:hypothetical protein
MTGGEKGSRITMKSFVPGKYEGGAIPETVIIKASGRHFQHEFCTV